MAVGGSFDSRSHPKRLHQYPDNETLGRRREVGGARGCCGLSTQQSVDADGFIN